MRRVLLLGLVSFGCIFQSNAQPSDLRLREALVVARTNRQAALALCDTAVAESPTNSQPLAIRARLLDYERRYSDALRDITAAVKLDPKLAQLWQARGEIHFKLSRFKESVADFDRVLELAPEQAPHHWQRGISLYYAGRFAEGCRQFELHRTVNPNDVENATWHFLCAAQERGVTNARAALLPVGPDGRVPMPEVYELYRGSGTVEQVIGAATRAAKDSRQPGVLFYAHLYLGLYFEVTGDLPKAREHIEKAARDPTANHYMGDVARVHQRHLASK